MGRSLLVRVLAPLLILLAGGAVLLLKDTLRQSERNRQLSFASTSREDFDRALLRFVGRHRRAIARLRQLAQAPLGAALQEIRASPAAAAAPNELHGTAESAIATAPDAAAAKDVLASMVVLSQQYASDSRHHLQGSEQLLAMIAGGSPSDGVTDDTQRFEIDRLRDELGRLDRRTTGIVGAMDRLLEARAAASPPTSPLAHPPALAAAPLAEPQTDDTEGGQDSNTEHEFEGGGESAAIVGSAKTDNNVDAVLSELSRLDTELQASVQLALGMSRRMHLRQQRRLLTASPLDAKAWYAWLAVAPLLLSLAGLPLWRLRRLARTSLTETAPRALSSEEALLSGALAQLRGAKEGLTHEVAEAEREADRNAGQARRAERELALLRIYNENLVNSLRTAILVTDVNGTLTAVNRTARQLFGIDDTDRGRTVDSLQLYQAIGQHMQDLSSDLQRALQGTPLRLTAINLGILGRGAVESPAEARTPSPSGDGTRERRDPLSPSSTVAASGPMVGDTQGIERLIDLSIIPYRDEGGAPRGLLWVADDVTAAIKMRDQLIAAEHLATVGRLSSQIAHEIRNPLSAIGLNAELLDEELANGLLPHRYDEARDLLRAIGGEIERLSQVTESYLQLARMPRPQCRSTDLNQVVTDLFTMLAPEMKAKAIEVRLQFASPAPCAWADPGQVRQALLNIVRNSGDAMQSGGVLAVKTENGTEQSHIEVTDTGSGIADDELSRVFEPFFSTKPEGTGLGLSLTHQIVREHGGRIDITSRKHGGTQVVLQLPQNPQSVAPVQSQ